MELLTKRLRLRRATTGDLDVIYAIMSNPDAMRYWSTEPHESHAVTAQWLNAMIAGHPDGGSDDFVIELDGRVVGKAGAWKLPEIGFILHPDYWGQGIASEAMTAVIAHLFRTHPVDALTADADPNNAASIGLLTKLGFRETGRAGRTFFFGGAWYDSIYFSLPRLRYEASSR